MGDQTQWQRVCTIIKMIQDSVLEQWPALKPGYQFFSREVSAMKRGWVLLAFSVLVSNCITWMITHNYMENRITAFSEAKMAKQPEFDKLLDQHYTDSSALWKDTKQAFDAGKYSYCVVFYERVRFLTSDRNALALEVPFYEMAKYASNPTKQGFSEFKSRLNAFVDDLKKHQDGPTCLSAVIENLNTVKERFTTKEDRDFINQTVDAIGQIKNTQSVPTVP